ALERTAMIETLQTDAAEVRRELDERRERRESDIFAMDDYLRAERAAENAQASSQVSKSRRDGLLYRVAENNEPAAYPESEDWEPVFSEVEEEIIATIIASERKRAAQLLAEAVAPLRQELTELRARVAALAAKVSVSDTEAATATKGPHDARALIG